MAFTISSRTQCAFLYPPRCMSRIRLFSASSHRQAKPPNGPAFLTTRQPAQKSNAIAMKEEMDKRAPEDYGLMPGIKMFISLVQGMSDKLSGSQERSLCPQARKSLQCSASRSSGSGSNGTGSEYGFPISPGKGVYRDGGRGTAGLYNRV